MTDFGTFVARWMAFALLLPYCRLRRGPLRRMTLRRLGARREVAFRFAIVLFFK